MDQLQVALAVLKKYHFWVLSGVVIVLGLAIWLFASQGLAKQFDERRQEIEGKREAAERIPSQPPNQDTIDELTSEINELSDNVFVSWKFLYELQTKLNKWPSALGEEFLSYIEGIKPPVMASEIKPESEIHRYYRETYWNFIRLHLPAIVEIVDIKLPAVLDEEGNIVEENGKPKKQNPFDSTVGTSAGYGGGMGGMMGGMAGGMMGGMGGMMEGEGEDSGYGYGGQTAGTSDKMIGKVDCAPAVLSNIQQQVGLPTFPTSGEVWLAQESLWVYGGLLRIIDKTNEGATADWNASVKRIDQLDIGFPAAQMFTGRSALFPSRSSGGGSAGSYGGTGAEGDEGLSMGGGSSMMSPGSMGMGDMGGMGMGGMGMGEETDYGDTGGGMADGGSGTGAGGTSLSPGEARVAQLMRGRYVDENGKPVADPAEQPFAEFKLMPIRMVLLVDQRKLPDLLVNCGNSEMTVEVRQVKIEPSATQGAGYGGSSYGGGMGGAPGGMLMGAGGGSMGLGDSGEEGYGYGSEGYGTGSASQMTASDSLDLTVEILGIITIYNPPDLEKLGTGTGPREGEVEAPTPDQPQQPAEPTTPPSTPGVDGPGATAPGPGATPAPGTVPPAGPGAGAATPPAVTPPAGTAPAGPAGQQGAPASAPPGAGTPGSGTVPPATGPGA